MKKLLILFLLLFNSVIFAFDNEGELIQDLNEKFDIVNQSSKIETKTDGTEWYIVNVGEIKKKSISYKNIGYYKLVNGNCFYQDVSPAEKSVFLSKINNELKNIYGIILRIDEDNEYAIVDGYVLDNEGLTNKKLLYTLDKDDNLYQQTIK